MYPFFYGGTLQPGDTDIGAKQKAASSRAEETDVTVQELTEKLETVSGGSQNLLQIPVI